MSRLRIYWKNGGSMLELVRYQEQELPVAVGAEEVIYSSAKTITAERKKREQLGMFADMPVYTIPYPNIKKIMAVKNHIWGL